MLDRSAPRLLGLASVIDRTSLSEPTIRRMMEADRFPKAVKISAKRIAWPEPAVNAWINERIGAAA